MDHLSSSQVSLYLLCGLKYRYQYVDRLPKPFRSSALVFGGALHAALAWLHEQWMKRKPATADTLYRIFEADWYSQKTEGPIKYKDKEDEMTLLVMGKEMLALYLEEKPKELLGCEVPFTVPLIDPETKEKLSINLEGYFDLVEADGTIVEFKTSAVALSRTDINSRLQLSAYGYAYSMLNRKQPNGFRVVNFVKGKKPKIAEVETKRDRNDYFGFLTVAKGVWNGIQSGVFIPSPSFICTDCEYRERCPLWQQGKGNGEETELYAPPPSKLSSAPQAMASPAKPNGGVNSEPITHQTQRSIPMSKQNGLFSASVKAGRTMFFVDVKEAKNGNKYLSITESRFEGNEKKKTSIRIFGETIQEFRQAIIDAAESALQS